MTAGTHSQGAFAKCIFSAKGDTAPHNYATGAGYLIEFLNESLGVNARHVSTDSGITGSRAHRSERVREGTPFRGGWIHMFVTAADMTHLLPLILGDNETPSGTFNPAEDVPYFGILIDTDYSTFEFLDCKVNQAIWRGRAPQYGEGGTPELMMLSLELYASDHALGTSWPGSPPTLSTQGPYVFTDTAGAITLNATAREVEDFVVVFHNHLHVLNANRLTAHSICPRDRTVIGRFQVPWNSDNANLYGMATAGAAASIVMTNGGLSTTMNFGRLQVPAERAMVPGKRAIPLVLQGEFRSVSTTPELVIVNDASP